MSTQTEAMKLALEALEYIEHNYMSLPAPAEKAITALQEALAEQPAQQEPWPEEPAGHKAGGVQLSGTSKSKAITELYALFGAPHNADINLTGLNRLLDELIASPPAQRTWVGLTDEERIMCRSYDPEEAVAKTEAKLKEKNT